MNDIENVVSLKNVKKAFGKNVVLDGIDLDVRKGEVVVICGRSGSGKSTLLRCIDQLETIDSGEIRAAGHLMGFREVKGKLVSLSDAAVARQQRDIGMVFQNFNLEINNNDRIALVGKNGTGKSTLTKIIDGVYKVDKNQLQFTGNIYARYEPYSMLNNEFNASENIRIFYSNHNYTIKKILKIEKKMWMTFYRKVGKMCVFLRFFLNKQEKKSEKAA